MAKSKYEYVKKFELDDTILPNCWAVVRVDGRSFSKFVEDHAYQRPNDDRGIHLMNHCAKMVMGEFSEIVYAYGISDEYSFILRRNAQLFQRRSSKINTTICSFFASTFVFSWSQFFPDVPLQYPPMFDGRLVLYPSIENLRDYISWRQVDCHINNLYNTAFWTLVQQGNMTPKEAEAELKGTLSDQKNEILFTRFGINYAHLPEIYRKGSIFIRKEAMVAVKEDKDGNPVHRKRRLITLIHDDVIKDTFWNEHPEILV